MRSDFTRYRMARQAIQEHAERELARSVLHQLNGASPTAKGKSPVPGMQAVAKEVDVEARETPGTRWRTPAAFDDVSLLISTAESVSETVVADLRS